MRTISVIIPVYNADKTLAKTLDSVLNQTADVQFEVIMTNDGSTDRSAEIMAEYQRKFPQLNIKIIHQENHGVSCARNAALKISTGEFVALLDADDIWLPEKTAKQLTILENSEISSVSAMRTHQKILPPYFIGKNNLAEVTFNKLLIRNEIPVSAVIFKRKVLENTGFFSEGQRYAEDVNFWMRLTKHNKMFILCETLLITGGEKRSFGVSGLSANLSKMDKGFRKNLHDMHQQKRIGFLSFLLLSVFYKMKYWLLILRSNYHKISAKN